MELTDAERGRALVERWCVLAEQRLEYLTELYESGRWRRFFSEAGFLENMKEAKTAVETWRDLLYREGSRDNRPVDLSWLGLNKQLKPRPIFYLSDDTAAEPPRRSLPIAGASSRAEAVAPESSPASTQVLEQTAAQLLQLVAAADPEPAAMAAPTIVPDEQPAWYHALDPVLLQQRYPMLRNAS